MFIFLRWVTILVIALSALVQAAPKYGFHGRGLHSTHRKRVFARGLELEVYHPKSTFKVSGNSIKVVCRIVCVPF